MRPPKDINQLEECTRWLDGLFYAWCVACDNWRTIQVVCEATVTYHQASSPQIRHARKLSYHCNCNLCGEDVGYLISSIDRARLVERLLIPAEDELLVTPAEVVESQPTTRQMRMEI